MPYETETVFSARPVPICEHWAYTKADSMGNELNSSVSENLKALTAGNPKKQCWMDLTSTKTPCAQYGQIGCAPCDDLLPPGPFPPTYPPNPGS